MVYLPPYLPAHRINLILKTNLLIKKGRIIRECKYCTWDASVNTEQVTFSATQRTDSLIVHLNDLLRDFCTYLNLFEQICPAHPG